MASLLRRTVRIVTDSSVHLPEDWLRKHNVIVLPQRVEINGAVLREGVEVDVAALAQMAARAEQPFVTHPPPLEEFVAVYEQLAAERADIISIHVAATLNQTVHVAQQARERVLGRTELQVLDSRTTAAGLGVLVKAAVSMAEQGMPFESIVRHVRGLAQNVFGVFLSDEMHYLERSGRLRPAQALLGKMLNIIAYLVFEDGALIAPEKVRTLEKGYEKIAEFAAEFEPSSGFYVVQLAPQPSHPRVRGLIDALRELMPNVRRVALSPSGAALGSVLGPSGIGLIITAFPPEEAAHVALKRAM